MGKISSVLVLICFLLLTQRSFAVVLELNVPVSSEEKYSDDAPPIKYFENGDVKVDPQAVGHWSLLFTPEVVGTIKSQTNPENSSIKNESTNFHSFSSIDGATYIVTKTKRPLNLHNLIASEGDKLFQITADAQLLREYEMKAKEVVPKVAAVLDAPRFFGLFLSVRAEKSKENELLKKINLDLDQSLPAVSCSIDQNGNLIWDAKKQILIKNFAQLSSHTSPFSAVTYTAEELPRLKMFKQFKRTMDASRMMMGRSFLTSIDVVENSSTAAATTWDFKNGTISTQPGKKLSTYEVWEDFEDHFKSMKSYSTDHLTLVQPYEAGTTVTNSWDFKTGDITVAGQTQNFFDYEKSGKLPAKKVSASGF